MEPKQRIEQLEALLRESTEYFEHGIHQRGFPCPACNMLEKIRVALGWKQVSR